jgi:SNF2 family DNA or RNA helicase
MNIGTPVGALAEGDEDLQPPEKAFERIVAYRNEKHIDPGQKHETLHADSGTPKAYEYLIKYKGLSFLHAEWVKPAVIEAAYMGEVRIQRFLATNPELDPILPFDPDWVEIDRIIAKRVRNGEIYYLIKWCALPYSESTWEKASQVNNDEKIAEYEFFNTLPPKSEWKAPATRPPANTFQAYPSFDFKSGNQLRAYQLEGVNWLRFCWYNKRNSILADEMGLGKTVQAVSTIFCLKRCEGIRGPFLVIAPLSTIPHWKREFEGWTDMNPIVYHGNMLAREIIRRHEFRYDDPESQAADVYKFNVIITTYEMVLKDAHIFRPVVWEYVAIDEAHRLKNQSSLLRELRTFRYNHLLLLTETPIQNNTEDLWTLLNLLDGEIFPSLHEFLREFGDLQNQDQVWKLQSLLMPFLLRRLKEAVLTIS